MLRQGADAGGQPSRPRGRLPHGRTTAGPQPGREGCRMSATADCVLDIRGLTVTFTGGAKPVRALDGVDLTLGRGEVVALLGESGSGKSVTLRSVLRLHPPKRARVEGSIRIDGTDVMALRGRALSDFRGRAVSV